LTGAQVEGAAILEVVPVEGVVSEAEELAGSASEPAETSAPEVTEEVHDDALPETSMGVVVRSPEIQDAEPIHSAPMSEAVTASCGGLELLADDLVNPTMVARNLESKRRTEKWMKIRDGTLEKSSSAGLEYPSNHCCIVQDVMERS
jgi:hypothetical protein